MVRRRPDRLFLLTGGAQRFTWSAGLPMVVWWVVELQLPPLQLALLGTALGLTILVAEAPTGVPADLYGRKPSVVASFAVVGTTIGLMAASVRVSGAAGGGEELGYPAVEGVVFYVVEAGVGQ